MFMFIYSYKHWNYEWKLCMPDNAQHLWTLNASNSFAACINCDDISTNWITTSMVNLAIFQNNHQESVVLSHQERFWIIFPVTESPRKHSVYSAYLSPSLCIWIFIQCKPDISRSCISRNWIYRGRRLDPIFLPTDFANFADVVPKSAIFSRNCGNSLHSIGGRQFFAKSAHRDSLCSCSLETIFREINSSLPVNAGWNTCCAMGSHARRSIDTSIVSQSRVQLIQCQCKSRLQTANLGINNAFNQIAVWPRCLHPPFCPSLRQFRSKSSVRDW